MCTPRRLGASCLLILCLLATVLAQAQSSTVGLKAGPTSTTVTASATAERVRFTAPSNVVWMQLQVISESGQILFDVNSKGNVLDWSLQDSSGQRLQGSYVTVVTVKSLSGRLSQRIGTVSVEERQVELKAGDATGMAPAQQEAVGPIEENAALTILKESEGQAITVIANDGKDGQLIRDRGALSFRLGDFFSGKDKEQMRLTEDGRLGIGTSDPQANLDVVGTIRAERVVIAKPGKPGSANQMLVAKTAEDINAAPEESLVSGSGSQDHIAKWTDNSGTLGDSAITETAGNVGIGTTTPGALLDVSNNTNHLQYSPTSAKLTLTGPAASLTANPGLRLDFNSDPDAGLSYLGYAHDNISQAYDAYWNGAAWVSSHPGANFAVYKNASQLAIGFNAGTAKGSTFPAFNTTTGVIFSKTGTMGIGGAPGAAKLYVDGNVGIGTTVPTAKLDVAGNINTSTQYNILGSRVLSTPGALNVFAGVDAGQSNTSGNQNSFFGNLAGSTNTTGELNSFFGKQAGTGNTGGRLNSFFGLASGTGNVDGNGNTAIGTLANVGLSNLVNATAIGFRAQVNQSNSLVLGSISGVNSATTNTNVGIGIPAPSATLHVVSYTNSAGENTVTFQAPNIGSNQSHIHYGTTGDWYIRSASNSGKVILQDTGIASNVGIGTGSPAAKLDVRDGTGASGSGGHLQIGAPNSDADEKIIAFGDSHCLGIPCVYIGEKDADDRMVLSANESFRFKAGNVLPDLDNNQTLGSSSNKWKEVWAVNGTIQTSDVRLKQRIANLKYGLRQVMQLRPVSFQWKTGNDMSTHLGLIAQEVDAVLPEAVEKSSDANAPLGINYSSLIPVLIKAIQEQQGTLERAQAQIKTLRTENEALSKRLISLEATSTVAASTKKAH